MRFFEFSPCPSHVFYCAVAGPDRDLHIAHERITREIKQGDLNVALADANRASKKYGKLSPEWDWRFRILRAQILVSRSESKEALALLNGELPPSLSSTDIAVRKTMLEGIAYRYLQQYQEQTTSWRRPRNWHSPFNPNYLCQILIAEAGVKFNQEKYGPAETDYNRAIALARQYGMPEQEANAQAALALISQNEDRLDEAVDRNQKALDSARSLKMSGLEATILGNLGWAYSALGDYENALQFYQAGCGGFGAHRPEWLLGLLVYRELQIPTFACADTLKRRI